VGLDEHPALGLALKKQVIPGFKGLLKAYRTRVQVLNEGASSAKPHG